ncbi:MAG: LOG family protein [Actinomycetota bacterium]
MTGRVIGAGGRGVVVATPDPAAALEDVRWLREAGVPATTPADAGLRAIAGFADASSSAAFWSAATRRAAVATEREERIVVRPGQPAGPVPPDPIGLVGDEPPARVAVFGGAWVGEEEPEFAEASRLGTALGQAGVGVVNGGYGGIMAAVSRGALEAGGTVVGVTISSFSEEVPVNPWLTHEVEADDLFARLPLICDAEAWVAFPGGVGTLSEVALCWNLIQTESLSPRPLIIVGERWDRALATFRQLLLAEGVHFDLVRPAVSADAALDAVRAAVGGGGGPIRPSVQY